VKRLTDPQVFRGRLALIWDLIIADFGTLI
jgi:hypothetical protein